MTKALKLMSLAIAAQFVVIPTSLAQQLTQDEVVAIMVDKPITTRSFGVKVNLRFKSNGVLTAKSFIGNYTGVWKRGSGDQICSTFNSGPAKGTQCNTYIKTGTNTYRTSSGTNFKVSH